MAARGEMMAETQYGLPLIVGNFTETAARGLKRIRFEKGNTDGYKERWLQKLVSRYPNVLPIEQIEPALTPAIPICMELPLASGFVDNLYATPDGDLIVGETKLFRNPEARREVIGQIIDYAKDLSALSYERLEEAILRAEAPDGSGGHPKVGLYEAVASVVGREEINEERFIDAVSRNLERGRFLLLVIGDGIQVGTENIAAFLQQHAGMHFTLGLVELAIFELPTEMGGYLVQPRILARTKNIDRGIVTIENGRITAMPPPDQNIGSKNVTKRTTISEEKFYEELAENFPTVVPHLKAFTARLEAVGIATEFGKTSMILRWHPDETRAWNLGTIATSGKVWTDVLNGQADAVGLLNLSHAYLKRLASLVPGALVKELPKPTTWYVAKGGTCITIDELLAHEDGWLDAIQEVTGAAAEALKYQ
jgi:hypothetical protein